MSEGYALDGCKPERSQGYDVGGHAHTQIKDERRLAADDIGRQRPDIGEDLSLRDGHHLVEELFDCRADLVLVNHSHYMEPLAQGTHRLGMGSIHGMAERKLFSDHDDSGSLPRARLRNLARLYTTSLQAGPAHLPHEIGLDRVFPRRERITAMHVDFRDLRQG